MKRLIVTLSLLLVALPAQTQDLSWPDAVSRLAGERTRAETCAGLLKQFGDAAAVARGRLAYAEAKAEIDAVIAGLLVVLAEGQAPARLPDLEARLTRGVTQREAFCTDVQALLPDRSGEKGLLVDIVKGALEPLIEAVKAIYLDLREADRLTRATIQTQLEATRWRAFDAIQP